MRTGSDVDHSPFLSPFGDDSTLFDSTGFDTVRGGMREHPLSLAPPRPLMGRGREGLGWSKKEKGPQPSRTTGTEVPTVGGLPCTSYDSTTVRGSQPFSWAHENDPTRQPRPVDQHRSGQRPAVKGGPDGPLAQPLTAGRRPDNPHGGGRRRREGAAQPPQPPPGGRRGGGPWR